MGTELKEVKTLVLKRVPPGDRWIFANGNGENIYPSLTDALEAWFQYNSDTQFYMDARKGIVEVVSNEEVEVIKPINKYSLYGEN